MPAEYSVLSPDGRIEVRAKIRPLGLEVLCHGKKAVSISRISLHGDGFSLPETPISVEKTVVRGIEHTPIYKKRSIDLARNGLILHFGEVALEAWARNDAAAYRFRLDKSASDRVRIHAETMQLSLPPSARCTVTHTGHFGCEESVPVSCNADELRTDGEDMIYLPMLYRVDDVSVAVTESDVRAYPVLNFKRDADESAAVALTAHFAGWPKRTEHRARTAVESGGRWIAVTEHENWLTELSGDDTLPWRLFLIAEDEVSRLVESDAVYAFAPPPMANADFSWVKPGKVAWDWWNAFDNLGDPEGCTTATYERFIDFAAANRLEYVILDEGWSRDLDIWHFSERVDVPHLIDYAEKRGVGIILWMAWAQVFGDEARIARHFAQLGVKGFKVDFMDRGDAEIGVFLERFAAECAKNHTLVDYHGVYRPSGMQRRYPNIVNYEGIHGLEQMKFFGGQDMMANDVAAVYLRMSAGPLDYTPGAMDNYPLGTYPAWHGVRDARYVNPGSLGTRCHQLAMFVIYEAPLQMLADSPTKYERNPESLRFIRAVPTVWTATVALGGTSETYAALARQSANGDWYFAALNNRDARSITIDTAFLGEGEWQAEIFEDALDAAENPGNCELTPIAIRAGEKLRFRLAPGGGLAAVVRRSVGETRAKD